MRKMIPATDATSEVPALATTQPVSMHRAAIAALEREGHVIVPSDVPGLVLVDGRELTMGQVLDLARGLETSPCAS